MSKPHWTTKPPSEPGSYWVKSRGDVNGNSHRVAELINPVFSDEMEWLMPGRSEGVDIDEFRDIGLQCWSEPVEKVG